MRVLGQLTLDLVGLAGLAGCVFGVHQVYPPAAWIVGGLMAFLGAAAVARKAK